MESPLGHSPTTNGVGGAETLPRRLGRYELVERLGGGMSEVYRARIGDAIGPERPLVVKIAAQSVSDDPRASARFLDEARLALALSHGNISSAFEFGKADGRYFIVMEYIRGSSVRQLVEQARRTGRHLSPGVALTIAIEVARALQYAHTFVHPELGAMPLVHRDVNPSNVLVARDGQVKLTDFGIAHALGRDPAHGVVWGQASYVAPELLSGEAASPASDLFGLGCVLFYMLTLEAPFRGETEEATLGAVLFGETPSARALVPDLPAEVDALVAALLAPSAAKRPATAEDARRELERLRAATDYRPSEIGSLLRDLLPEAVTTPAAARIEAMTEPTVPLVTAEPLAMRASTPPAGAPVPAMPTPGSPTREARWGGAPKAAAPESRTRTALVLVGTAAIAVLATAAFLRRNDDTPRRATRETRPAAAERVDERSSPAPVTKITAPAPTKATAPEAPGPSTPAVVKGAPAKTTKRAMGGLGAQVVAVSNPPPPPPPPSDEPAVVTLNSFPWSIVAVDGRTLPGHTPLRGVELPPGPHTFRFVNPELHMSRVVTVRLEPGERRLVTTPLQPDDAAGGPSQHATP